MQTYNDALEKRLEWSRWGQTRANQFYGESEMLRASLAVFNTTLQNGDTFFMNEQFCDLVDLARRTVPDDLVFEESWLVRPEGWMMLEKPFAVPMIKDFSIFRLPTQQCYIKAIGWRRIPDEKVDAINARNGNQNIPRGSVRVVTFLDWNTVNTGDRHREGFGMWSYFRLNPGEKVIDRIRVFEDRTATEQEGVYVESRESDVLHEMRWVYTAFHLMSQRLAITQSATAARGTRKRMQRDSNPLSQEIKVVALRRTVERPPVVPGQEHKAVNWHYQWLVPGFWRQQWYPVEKVHRRIWIEDFVKGPAHLPMKPTPHTVFQVRR